MKNNLNIVKRTIVLFTLIYIIISFIVPYCVKNITHIKPYAEFVKEAADIYNIDENLIYSVMKVESKFKSYAISNRDAIGLMQILQPTADEIILEIHNDTITTKLDNPKNNIHIGSKYLSNLLKRYDNNIGIAIAAYNAGIGNVNKWLENGIISKEDSSSLINIPFPETREYVNKVLRTYKIYNKLYKNKK